VTALRLIGLAKRFGDAVAAVDGIHLDIERGQMVSLLGPSGCGKTTTLRLVAGFLRPDGGEIRLGETVLSSVRALVPPERRRMAMIFQNYAVWPHMTVAGNVAYGLRLRRLPREEIGRRMAQVLKLVHLEGMEGRYPSTLSGGQQQRVALARALVVEPETLLLDEPLSNLDANLREEMRFEIRRLHETLGITTIYVTHDQAEAMVTSDRIAVMHRGRIEQVGTPEEIYTRPRTPFVAGFIGRANLLPAVAAGRGQVCLAGVLLRTEAVEGWEPAEGAPVLLCLRPNEVRLRAPEAVAPEGANALAGCIVRHVYLGESRDYLVALEGSPSTLRAITRASERFAVGARVAIHIAPDQCWVVRPEP